MLRATERVPQLGDKIHYTGSWNTCCYERFVAVTRTPDGRSWLVRWSSGHSVLETDVKHLRYIAQWGLWIGAVGASRVNLNQRSAACQM